MTAVPGLADAAGPHRVDLCRLVLAVERRPVALEGETTLRRLALLPTRVCAMDRLTRLAPADPALDELVCERSQSLLLVGKMGKETGHRGSVRPAGGTRIRERLARVPSRRLHALAFSRRRHPQIPRSSSSWPGGCRWTPRPALGSRSLRGGPSRG